MRGDHLGELVIPEYGGLPVPPRAWRGIQQRQLLTPVAPCASSSLAERGPTLSVMPTLAVAHSSGAAATFTDYLTGWGTISLAAATFTAVVVSIWLARADRRRADRERDDRQRAQARLIRASAPTAPETERTETGYHHVFTFPFANYSDRPVMEVHLEAWAGPGARLDQPAPWHATGDRIVFPGQEKHYLVGAQSEEGNLGLGAWRVRWTDADGRQWCIDQIGQREPLLYKGQQPRPYPGTQP